MPGLGTRTPGEAPGSGEVARIAVLVLVIAAVVWLNSTNVLGLRHAPLPWVLFLALGAFVEGYAWLHVVRHTRRRTVRIVCTIAASVAVLALATPLVWPGLRTPAWIVVFLAASWVVGVTYALAASGARREQEERDARWRG